MVSYTVHAEMRIQSHLFFFNANKSFPFLSLERLVDTCEQLLSEISDHIGCLWA